MRACVRACYVCCMCILSTETRLVRVLARARVWCVCAVDALCGDVEQHAQQARRVVGEQPRPLRREEPQDRVARPAPAASGTAPGGPASRDADG